MFEWFALSRKNCCFVSVLVSSRRTCRRYTVRLYFRARLYPFYYSFAPAALFKALSSDRQLNGPLVYLIDFIKYPAATHDTINKID